MVVRRHGDAKSSAIYIDDTGQARVETPIAFQALIVTIRLTSAPELVRARNCAEASSQAVSGTWRLGDAGDRLGQGQGGPLPGVEQRRFGPDGEQGEPLFGLAGGSRVGAQCMFTQ